MSLTLTWANRNRVLQADQVVDWSAGSTGVEAGQHTALQVFNASNVLLAEKLDIDGETATVTSDYVGTLKFKLWSIRDDLDSWQPVEFEAVNAAPSGTTTVIDAATWVPGPTSTERFTRITAEGDFRVTSDGSLRECL